jgi:hypothetical protein
VHLNVIIASISLSLGARKKNPVHKKKGRMETHPEEVQGKKKERPKNC